MWIVSCYLTRPLVLVGTVKTEGEFFAPEIFFVRFPFHGPYLPLGVFSCDTTQAGHPRTYMHLEIVTLRTSRGVKAAGYSGTPGLKACKTFPPCAALRARAPFATDLCIGSRLFLGTGEVWYPFTFYIRCIYTSCLKVTIPALSALMAFGLDER